MILSAPDVVEIIPHDPGAFTQGFEYRNGYIWETTGTYGSSSFRCTSRETGEVLETFLFPDSVFTEGFTFLNDTTVCILTWREGVAYLLHTGRMEITGELPLEREGWGLCLAGDTLWHSDGSSTLYLRDRETFALLDSVQVTLDGVPQYYLNELEFTRDLILANQWRTSRILFINRGTGIVQRVLDLSDFHPGTGGVLNGISAGDEGEFYCTGKNWPVTLILKGIAESD